MLIYRSRNLDFRNPRPRFSLHTKFQVCTIILKIFEISGVSRVLGSRTQRSLKTLIFKILDLDLVYVQNFSSLRSLFKLLKFSWYAQGREAFYDRLNGERSRTQWSLETLIFKILDLELVYILNFSSLRSFFKLFEISWCVQGREVCDRLDGERLRVEVIFLATTALLSRYLWKVISTIYNSQQ